MIWPRRSLRRTMRSFQMALSSWGVILLYHRVATVKSDPQLLCVSPERFREHLEVLNRGYNAISLLGLGESVSKGNVPPWSTAITFDDGYADNLQIAAPLLQLYKIPGTVFVTGQILQGNEFFYDTLEDVLLHTRCLPDVLSFSGCEQEKKWPLGLWAEWPEEPGPEYWSWHVGLKADPTPRHWAYREIFTWLREASPQVREVALDQLCEWAGPDMWHPTFPRGMTNADLLAAAQGGILEIGAHTLSHPVLSALGESDQEHEIVEGKRVLEDILQKPVNSFAYPYGTSWDVGAEAVRIAEQAGFAVSCANMPGTVNRHSHPHWLPRFLVRNWTGKEFASRLEDFFSPQRIRPPIGRMG